MIKRSPVRRALVRLRLRVSPGAMHLPSCGWHEMTMADSGTKADSMTNGELAGTVREMTKIAGEMTKIAAGRGAAGARANGTMATDGAKTTGGRGPVGDQGFRIEPPERRLGSTLRGRLIVDICPRRPRITHTACSSTVTGSRSRMSLLDR